MANTYYAPDYNMKALHVSAHGNGWSEDYAASAQAATGDTIYLGIIPGGVRVHGVRLLHGAAGAGAALRLGFEPVDATGPAASADYWADGADVEAAGAVDSAASPVTFDGPVKLVATVTGAFANSTTLTAVVTGKVVGVA